MSSKKKIILGVTGSIAAYKAADLIRRLQEKDFEVSVIMTKEAEAFITPLTLTSLSGNNVYRDMFDDRVSASGAGEAWVMDHIRLAQEADLLLIAPATANIIGKIACGLADDLLTCTAMATAAPILIVPAMNEEMYKSKIVQSNCQKLKEAGIHFIQPVKGKLACGTTGIGHIADVDDIVKSVVKLVR